ncbi:hypothetical protein BJY00DRAFT_111456 [Aspergillus carlsbadensis]|nr:hypothetical protein BJY00DRAFT_111456 [Aspergillus carlsbadensis]
MASDPIIASDYEIAIISDSRSTGIAIRQLCDEIHERTVGTPDSKKLSYAIGKIGRHRVFMADRHQGDLVMDHYMHIHTLAQHFKADKLVLLVGRCAAVPFAENHDVTSDTTSIVLGDVIVATDIVEEPDFDYDSNRNAQLQDKKLDKEFEERRRRARAFVEELESEKEQFQAATARGLTATLEKPSRKGYQQLRTEARKMFPADYLHKHRDGQCLDCEDGPEPCHKATYSSSCEGLRCEASYMKPHDYHQRLEQHPAVHFGSIYTGSPPWTRQFRDRLAKTHGVIGFESQAAALFHYLPVVMVQGVAHHMDGHRFHSWATYAGLAAASAALCLLDRWDYGVGLERPRRDPYISFFTNELVSRALGEKPEKMGLSELYEALPELLQTFAIKARAGAVAQVVQDSMSFIRKYRFEITRVAGNKYQKEYILGGELISTNEGDVSSTTCDRTPERTERGINAAPADTDVENRSNRSIDPVYSLPEISVFRDLVIQLPAYKWLLGSIQNVLYLSVPEGEPVGIRTAIIEHLPKSRWIDTPPRHSLTLTTKWDPRSFLLEQGYTEEPDIALERAITITGCTEDAQAITVAQYLGQVWPSTGRQFLRIIKDVVRGEFDTPCNYDLPDGTHIAVLSRGPPFTVEVNGIAESIAEIGEQLAWLSAAFQSPINNARVNVVRASLGEMWTSLSREQTGITTFCNINIDIHAVQDTPNKLNGQCWQKLFRSPVIVAGYPIPRRPKYGVGLEVELDTMASLLATDRISVFGNKMYLKAFAMMLFPTQHVGDIIVWHLLWSDRDRISYLKSKGILKQNLSISDLESCRHIVGWCTDVRYMIGSGDANYDVGPSWLRGVEENSQLKEVSISQGRLIKSDQKPALGKRDISPLVTRGTLRAKLEALSKRYVVLWDVGSKRGWLVNGPSALLHLLRASLRSNQVDDLSFAFLFDPATFEEAKAPYTVSAALQVLMNPKNLDLALYEDDSEGCPKPNYYRVRDRLNDLYEVVEKMLDYQIMICGKDGVKLRGVPRRDLEGWDFKDIATKEDPIYPRLAKLKTTGKSWVDFVRATQAVVLFGRDFGDLVEPSATTDLCSHWKSLPCDRYYLAACMGDLKRIFDRSGHLLSMHSGPTSFVWHPSEPTFSPSCRHNEEEDLPCEPARTVWRESTSLWKLENTTYSGAVIFGHSSQSEWIWRDTGEPERGSLPLSDEESDGNSQADSGLGSSLRSSAVPERQRALEGPNLAGFTHKDYRVAIICALSKELLAVRALFDSSHGDLPTNENDTNTYALGSMGNHNVVAACLPSEEYGTNAASKVASDMEKSFPAVKWHFVVGIGGGVPSSEHDIRLGDVVVSTSVVQHDIGRTIQGDGRFESTALVQRPARSLMTAISLLQSDPYHTHDCLELDIEQIVNLRPEYKDPGQAHDRLFEPHYKHEPGYRTCTNCSGPEVNRKRRSPGPRIHYGRIASGNQVIKDAHTRDRIAETLKASCFEMEGAGVMTTGRCLVIRGICDYADSHKNDEWHNYAAATAAAYTKFFLLRLPVLNREMVHLQKRSVASLDEVELSVKRVRYERDWI